MAVSGDDPAGERPLPEPTFNGAWRDPLLCWTRVSVSMTLFFEKANSGTREGDAGGRTGNNVFAPSDLVTGGGRSTQHYY